MPGLDGTGPLGRGPRTGWGMGRCRPFGGAPIAPQAQQQVTPAEEKGTQVPPAQGTTEYAASGEDPVIYGRGRGGIPFGCGRGFGRGRRGRFFW